MLPALENWFSGSAVFLAGSFVFTVVVGLIGIRTMVPDRLFIFLLFVALNLSLLAWYVAARQEENASKTTDILQAIATGGRPIEQPDFVEALRRNTPAQLRQAVSDFSQELRQFDDEIMNRTVKSTNAMMSRTRNAKTDDERNRVWQEQVNAQLQQSQTNLAEFDARFRVCPGTSGGITKFSEHEAD